MPVDTRCKVLQDGVENARTDVNKIVGRTSLRALMKLVLGLQSVTGNAECAMINSFNQFVDLPLPSLPLFPLCRTPNLRISASIHVSHKPDLSLYHRNGIGISAS